MESLLYAFFISESEAPASNPRILNGSKTCIWIIRMQEKGHVHFKEKKNKKRLHKKTQYTDLDSYQDGKFFITFV